VIWIKVEHGLANKPEVLAISQQLGIPRLDVVGRLIAIWEWFDANTTDGTNPAVTRAFLDELSNCFGFSLAMSSVGWLDEFRGVLSIPNFERHNGESAKRRALASTRMAKTRVRKVLRSQRNKSATREEKRREDSSPNGELFTWPPGMETKEAKEALSRWLEFKRSAGQSYRRKQHVNALLSRFAEHGPAALCQAVDFAIANNLTWIRPYKESKTNGGQHRNKLRGLYRETADGQG